MSTAKPFLDPDMIKRQVDRPIDSVMLLSGGMDSVTLLYYITQKKNYKPLALVFDYGQKHNVEIQFAAEHAAKLNVPALLVPVADIFAAIGIRSALIQADEPIPPLEQVLGDPQPPTYVPNRNQLMLALAASIAESFGVHTLFYGAQKSDQYGYWDTTAQFVERLNAVYSLNRKTPINIQAPFVDIRKMGILAIGHYDLQIDYARTWSCYEGNYDAGACGKCPTCRERLAAFDNLKLIDPLRYQV